MGDFENSEQMNHDMTKIFKIDREMTQSIK